MVIDLGSEMEGKVFDGIDGHLFLKNFPSVDICNSVVIKLKFNEIKEKSINIKWMNKFPKELLFL